MRNVLPDQVYNSISRHLRLQGNEAHLDWEMGEEEEDALTGAAFAHFRTRYPVRVNAGGRDWEWRIRTRKLRGRGPGAIEKQSGADGIIEIEVKHETTGAVEKKALLVQGKKKWTGRNPSLQSQIERMEDLLPGSSAAIIYGPDRYMAVDGHAVLLAEGDRRELPEGGGATLGDFLADRFLECRVGRRGLHYDASRRLLILPSPGIDQDALWLPVGNAMRIHINKKVHNMSLQPAARDARGG